MKKCPYCHSINTNKYIQVKGWPIIKCNTCLLLFSDLGNKKMKSKASFYEETYISGYLAREMEMKNRFKYRLSKIEKYKQRGSILDIGCSLGFFLQIAKQSGWKVFGVEPSNKLRMYAKKKAGLNFVKGSLSNIPFKDHSFDCVTCFDVLEHDTNLHKNINEIRRVLKTGGIFVVQAPNYHSLMAYMCGKNWDWWTPQDHVLHFSFEFLKRILQESGFNVLESYTYEESKDFLLNIRGTFHKNFFLKIVFYLSLPFLLALEWFFWNLNLGGLSFVIAEKK